ncbi:MAG: pantoate--beta-alanine ligase [Candidatus Omnitrophota bacterium]
MRSIKEMQQIVRNLKHDRQTIGFVPTMGALHSGHLSLIKEAGKENNFIIVSIFVNPAQFGPGEDFKQYPRNLSDDILRCRDMGVDFIFSPAVGQVYPDGYKTYVVVDGLTKGLCGRLRPGHFKGVATIVVKLFNIILPDIAYFGQKDAQQAVIIRRMVRDLNMPVKVKVMPIVRESDGLAMSSRNRYLTDKGRKDAVVLFEALKEAKKMIARGVNDSAKIIRAMREIINKKKTIKVQYIEIVDLDRLNPVKTIRGKALLALAVYAGKTRLIDNIVVRGE